MLYFDSSYVVRLYVADPGWEKVQALAKTDRIACCLHGQAETVAAFHRKFREGALTQKLFSELVVQFQKDSDAGAFEWLLIAPAMISRLIKRYTSLSSTIHLRAADAIHLACAAESGFKEVYSNDVHLLDAANDFGIKGVNIV